MITKSQIIVIILILVILYLSYLIFKKPVLELFSSGSSSTTSSTTSSTKSDVIKHITTIEECTAAGGEYYSYCPETGKHYCCEIDETDSYHVCSGSDGFCPSNSGLQHCVCPYSFSLFKSKIFDSSDVDANFDVKRIAMSRDGNTIAKSSFTSSSAVVKIYKLNGTNWETNTDSTFTIGAEIDQMCFNEDGTTLAIGCRTINKVYLSYFNSNSWSSLSLSSSSISGSSAFGSSVALNSDGTRLVIGASSGNGYIEVYQKSSTSNTWSSLGNALDGKTGTGMLGHWVAINGAGNRIIGGAPAKDENSQLPGYVRIYSLNSSNDWDLMQTIEHSSPGGEKYFLGYSVSMNLSGDTIMFGSPSKNNNKGQVSVYRNSTGASEGYVQMGSHIDGLRETTPPSGSSGEEIDTNFGDELGVCVALSSDGNRIFASAMRKLNDNNLKKYAGCINVYDFDSSINDWIKVFSLYGQDEHNKFGRYFYINGEGDRVIALLNTDCCGRDPTAKGEAHLFDLIEILPQVTGPVIDTSYVIFESKIFESSEVGDNFDVKRVAMSRDGNTIATASFNYLIPVTTSALLTSSVSSTNVVVKVYKMIGTDWVKTSNDTTFTLNLSTKEIDHICFNDNGTSIAIGSRLNDRVFTSYFDATSNAWSTLAVITSTDDLGTSVALNSDGLRLVVGGSAGNGLIKVYFKTSVGGTWSQQGSDLVGKSGKGMLGHWVAINGVGNRIIGGAPAKYSDSSLTGYVRIYSLNSLNDWDLMQTIEHSSPGSEKYFSGYSVSMNLSGDTIMFGSPNRNNQKGQVSVYRNPTGASEGYVQMGSHIDGIRETSAVPSFVESGDHTLGDGLGICVALSSDGNRIFASAMRKINGSKLFVGCIDVYDFDTTNNEWEKVYTLFGKEYNNKLGRYFYINGDGDRVMTHLNNGYPVSVGDANVYDLIGISPPTTTPIPISTTPYVTEFSLYPSNQKYRCDDIKGCFPDDNGPYSYEECTTECRFKYNPSTKICDKDPTGEFDSNFKCSTRFVCDEDIGKCVSKPFSMAGSYSNYSSCQENCKFKVFNSDSCVKVEPDELLTLEKDKMYDTKDNCENRYKCYNGLCKKTSGGEFLKMRHCKQHCVEDIYNPNNPNVLRFTFVQKLKNMANFNKLELLKKLKKIVVGNNEFINGSNLLNFNTDKEELDKSFDLEENIIIVRLSTLIDLKIIGELFDDLIERIKLNNNIFVNFTGYKILDVTLGVDNLYTFPTVPSIKYSADRLFIEITNLSDKLRVKTLKQKKILNIDSSSSKSEKINYLNGLLNNSYKGKRDIVLPEVSFLRSLNSDTKEYKTDEEDNTYMYVRDIDNNYLEVLKEIKYLDFATIKSLYENNNYVKFMILGETDKSNIFEYKNECYLVLYNKKGNNFKYKQIMVDFEVYKKFNIERAKFCVNSNKMVTQLTLENYQTINGFQTFEKGDKLESLIFDEYNTDLKFKFSISIFENDILKDVNAYVEDGELSLNQITCSFEPYGETKFECKQLCSEDSKNNNCSEADCAVKCNNCMNLNCRWNVTNFNQNMKLKPSAPKIKVFSGNNSLKVNWIKPFSTTEIEKYYIMVSSPTEKFLNIYQYESPLEMVEYTVVNLKNNVVYDVQVSCKNKFGASGLSNEESVIPKKTSQLGVVSDIKLSDYEDSIENFYKNNFSQDEGNVKFDLNKQISQFEREIVLNDLKEILTDKLIGKKNISSHNIKVF